MSHTFIIRWTVWRKNIGKTFSCPIVEVLLKYGNMELLFYVFVLMFSYVFFSHVRGVALIFEMCFYKYDINNWWILFPGNEKENHECRSFINLTFNEGILP